MKQNWLPGEKLEKLPHLGPPCFATCVPLLTSADQLEFKNFIRNGIWTLAGVNRLTIITALSPLGHQATLLAKDFTFINFTIFHKFLHSNYTFVCKVNNYIIKQLTTAADLLLVKPTTTLRKSV